jgi:hypothetical protein
MRDRKIPTLAVVSKESGEYTLMAGCTFFYSIFPAYFLRTHRVDIVLMCV